MGRLTSELSKELKQLEKDIKQSESDINIYKNKISDELKNIDKNKVFNTIQVDKKYTLWERIMRSLGLS